MKALVTGASSGIGRDIARELYSMGIDLVITARREDRLIDLKRELGGNPEIICADLSKESECIRLFETADDVDILINNAGFGVFGEFFETSLARELDMIDLNIRAMHTLMKLYLCKFKEKNSGIILNVASSAAFFPGAFFSSYYASKAYVLRLTQAVSSELRREKSGVFVCALCPGPVDTEFNDTADVRVALKGKSSKYIAKYAVYKMFKHKTVIIPGVSMKIFKIFSKIMPDSFLAWCTYYIQRRKSKDKTKIY